MRRRTLLEALPYAVAAAVLLAVSGRAFHIDDATFLLYGREALKSPLHPYGPWGAQGASNPPGNAWLLAVVLALFGDSERAIHLALLPFAMAALFASRALAKRFGVPEPWRVPLLVACSGPFLLSASTLMPDVVALGFTVPAVALLVSDAGEPRAWKLLLCSVLFATGWTFRISATPVLGIAAVWQLGRRNLRAAAPLAALVVAFAAWTLFSAHTDAGVSQTVATARLHGSFGPLFLWRLLSTSASLILFTPVVVALLVLLPSPPGARRMLEWVGFGVALCAAFAPFATALVALGTAMLLVARARLPRLREGEWFLWGWIAIALLVPLTYNQATAKFLNLLLVPAAILLFRRTDDVRKTLAVCAFGLAVAAPVAVADFLHAGALRDVTVAQIAAARRDGAAHVYVAGTPWGAIEYARRHGATFLYGTLKRGSPAADQLSPGDEIVDLSWPGALALPPESARLLREGEANTRWPIRTMAGGAGLWSSDWGLLPFRVSTEPLQVYWRVRVIAKVQ